MKKKLIIKTIIYVILSFIVISIFKIASPIIGNYAALQQMNISMDSSSYIQIFSMIQNNFYLIWILVTILVYLKDLIKLYCILKEKIV